MYNAKGRPDFLMIKKGSLEGSLGHCVGEHFFISLVRLHSCVQLVAAFHLYILASASRFMPTSNSLSFFDKVHINSTHIINSNIYSLAPILLLAILKPPSLYSKRKGESFNSPSPITSRSIPLSKSLPVPPLPLPHCALLPLLPSSALELFLVASQVH